MKMRTLVVSLAALLVLLVSLVACGAAQESAAAAPQGRPGLPGAPGFPGSQAPQAQAAQPPAAPAAAARRPTAVPEATSGQLEKVEVVKEVAAMSEESSEAGEFSEERAALVAQNRIIVRTVHLALEVDDVADSIEEISQSVQRDGGWVVSTDRSSKHYGFIAVRVPAAKLDDALKWMRAGGRGCAVGGFDEHGCYGRIL